MPGAAFLPPPDFPRPAIIRAAPKELVDPRGNPLRNRGLVFPQQVYVGKPFIFAGTYNVAGNTFRPVTDAGGQAGDLMVAVSMIYLYHENSGNGDPGDPLPTWSGQAGWTLAHSVTGTTFLDNPFGGNDSRWGIFTTIMYRRLDGTETGVVNPYSGGSGVGYLQTRVLRFTGGGTSITVHGQNGSYTNGNPSSMSIVASALSPPLIIIGAAIAEGANSTLNFSTFSPTFDTSYHVIQSSTFRTRVAYKIYNSGPQDTTIDMGDSGPNANELIACIIKG